MEISSPSERDIAVYGVQYLNREISKPHVRPNKRFASNFFRKMAYTLLTGPAFILISHHHEPLTSQILQNKILLVKIACLELVLLVMNDGEISKI